MQLIEPILIQGKKCLLIKENRITKPHSMAIVHNPMGLQLISAYINDHLLTTIVHNRKVSPQTNENTTI